MIIIHKIDYFLFSLFPAIKEGRKEGDKDLSALKEELTKYYTFGPYKPKVDIQNDIVSIDIDVSSISSQKAYFDIVVKHCEAGRFKKAKPLIAKLIKKNPSISEYHRILGQILSDEGNQEQAVNCLIDALRWDPRNTHALTMMGNIFARSKDDISTAMSYYEQALVVRPGDHIAMNNIGANLMLLGRVEEAGQYFEKAYAIDSSYPNTIYALGMLKNLKDDHQAALDFATQAMKKCAPSNPVYSNALELAHSSAHKVAGMTDGMEMFNQYSQRLAVESGKNIEVIQDANVPTPAKLEMAENYKRDRHIIRFKKDRQAIIHLMMHELVHLDFAVRCRKINANYLFITTIEQKELFIRNNEPCISRLNREGYDDKAIAGFVTALFNGINSSIYNTPIDLFIEDFLYKSYPAMVLALAISISLIYGIQNFSLNRRLCWCCRDLALLCEAEQECPFYL